MPLLECDGCRLRYSGRRTCAHWQCAAANGWSFQSDQKQKAIVKDEKGKTVKEVSRMKMCEFCRDHLPAECAGVTFNPLCTFVCDLSTACAFAEFASCRPRVQYRGRSQRRRRPTPPRSASFLSLSFISNVDSPVIDIRRERPPEADSKRTHGASQTAAYSQ